MLKGRLARIRMHCAQSARAITRPTIGQVPYECTENSSLSKSQFSLVARLRTIIIKNPTQAGSLAEGIKV